MKHIAIPALAVCLSTAALAPISAVSAAAAEIPETQNQEYSVVNAENDIQPRLFTQVTLNIRSSQTTGYVEGFAKNTFTFFPSQVYVKVFLYYSYTYTTDRSQMKLETMKISPDLDMGHEVVAKASTNGEQKYWCAYMEFSADGGEVKTGQTDTILYNANGVAVYI